MDSVLGKPLNNGSLHDLALILGNIRIFSESKCELQVTA
jgi:hypothetical protein